VRESYPETGEVVRIDSEISNTRQREEGPDFRCTEPAVLVVGAGPTGLLLAAELCRRGVSCQLIDATPELLHWDRATVVHPRSLEVIESLGLIQRFLDTGVPQRIVRLHSDGVILGEIDLSTCGSIYGFNLGISEEVTESILIDYLHSQGGEVIRSCRLIALEPHSDGILADVMRNGERHNVRARWVVGCDGIHSTTRQAAGIELEGHDIEEPWAVFDATLQGWVGEFEASYAYFDAVPVILTALPHRRWRVYLRPTSPDADLVADAASTIGRYQPAASFVDVENPTRFHCHTKVADRFRAGRVLLAGDAAHVCSPAQGHGMNSGLQDAFNLAWKLALVCDGVADPRLLDSYEVERRPVAVLVTQSGDAAERTQIVTGQAEREVRDRALRAIFADPAARHHEVVAETELDVEYTHSPIVLGDANARLASGERLPDTIAVHPWGASPCGLHQLAHRPGHTVLVLGGPTADVHELTRLLTLLQALVGSSPVFETAVALSASPTSPEQVGRLDAAGAEALGVEGVSVLVVRPDGYIGLRADQDHLAALTRYEATLRG